MNRGDSALGFALACYGMGSLLVAVATPRVVERIGVIRTMSVGIAVTVMSLAAAVALTVVVQSTGTGWEWLLGTWFALGIGTSLINTPASRLLADASTDRNRNLVYTAQFALSHACFLLTYPIAGQLGASSLTLAVSALAAIAVLAAVAATVVARRAQVPTWWSE
jgi:MFS family permease